MQGSPFVDAVTGSVQAMMPARDPLAVWSFGLSLASIFLALAALFLFFAAERVRRPVIEFLHKRDQVDPQANPMWYHIWVQVERPRRVFNRDGAISSVARIEFGQFEDNKSFRPFPSPRQVWAHWSDLGEPRIRNRFLEFLIPLVTRIDLGFQDRKFDVLIKFPDSDTIYAADPRIVYRLRSAADLEQIRVPANDCIIRVEVDAINMGKPFEAFYRLQNQGPGPGGVAISRIGSRKQLR